VLMLFPWVANIDIMPVEYLAPEVAVGQPASPASDVWALGCSIIRLRAGEGLFSAYDVNSPADLMRSIIQVLGEVPAAWGDTLFDMDGQPTKDPAKANLSGSSRTNGPSKNGPIGYGINRAVELAIQRNRWQQAKERIQTRSMIGKNICLTLLAICTSSGNLQLSS